MHVLYKLCGRFFDIIKMYLWPFDGDDIKVQNYSLLT